MLLFKCNLRQQEAKKSDSRRKKAIAKRIKYYRICSGHSKEFVALELEITASNVEKYENGQRTPPIDKAKQMAEMYGVSVDDFLNEQIVPILQKDKLTEVKSILASNDNQKISELRQQLLSSGYSESQIDWFFNKFTIVKK